MSESTKADPQGEDSAILEAVEAVLVASAGGREQLRTNLAKLLRTALDEVIDTPRTRRLMLEELEKTEKTYIGTKVEILFRNMLGLSKGKRLDLRVGDRDADVKFTIGGNWTIPMEAIDEVCVLISCSERSATFKLGLFVARLAYLGQGMNRDSKRTVSAAGREFIRWIFFDEPYPRNFWAGYTAQQAVHIMDASVSGNERLRRLFQISAGSPIPRRIVESVAQQRDYMKRLRKNGGVRDLLEKDGYLLLSGTYDSAAIAARQLPACARDEFICVKA